MKLASAQPNNQEESISATTVGTLRPISHRTVSLQHENHINFKKIKKELSNLMEYCNMGNSI